MPRSETDRARERIRDEFNNFVDDEIARQNAPPIDLDLDEPQEDASHEEARRNMVARVRALKGLDPEPILSSSEEEDARDLESLVTVAGKRPRYAMAAEADSESSSNGDDDPANALANTFDAMGVANKERILICRGYASYLAASERSKSTRHKKSKPSPPHSVRKY